jgi:hypothetical protein
MCGHIPIILHLFRSICLFSFLGAISWHRKTIILMQWNQSINILRSTWPLNQYCWCSNGNIRTDFDGNNHSSTTDNNGKKHTFTLTHVNYMPKLPVNIMSTWVLSEQYVDENELDKKGTGVCSIHDDPILFGIMVNSSKYSGCILLVYLNVFLILAILIWIPSQHFWCSIMMIQSIWHLLQRIKTLNLQLQMRALEFQILHDNGHVTLDVPLPLTNMISFMQGIKIRNNNGFGSRDIVTFLGIDSVEDMRLKCKIKLSNDLDMLVDIEILNFIENPDITLISETSEDYFWDSTLNTPSQLEYILHPKTLSPMQEEIISHHTWLRHVPFPQLIVMAESGDIPHCLASLKDCCPISSPCLFGQAHKCPWQSKSKKLHPIWKKSDDHSGAQASMDHLVSEQPGLIPQVSDKLTSMHINGGTVIIDHYSDHVNVLLMCDISLEENLYAKYAYEQYLSWLESLQRLIMLTMDDLQIKTSKMTA